MTGTSAVTMSASLCPPRPYQYLASPPINLPIPAQQMLPLKAMPSARALQHKGFAPLNNFLASCGLQCLSYVSQRHSHSPVSSPSLRWTVCYVRLSFLHLFIIFYLANLFISPLVLYKPTCPIANLGYFVNLSTWFGVFIVILLDP